MDYISHYHSPLGEITLASDGESLIGLWFDGQKYDRAGLARNYCEEDTVGLVRGSREYDCAGVARDSREDDHAGGMRDFWEDDRAGMDREYREEEIPVLRQAARWLDAYFQGTVPEEEIPLAPRGTEFRRRVWKILGEIPWGETMTYGQIAERLTDSPEKARLLARAVGGAVGHNPISILIPCHRVLGADHSLTGYAGGIERKQKLLEIEHIR